MQILHQKAVAAGVGPLIGGRKQLWVPDTKRGWHFVRIVRCIASFSCYYYCVNQQIALPLPPRKNYCSLNGCFTWKFFVPPSQLKQGSALVTLITRKSRPKTPCILFAIAEGPFHVPINTSLNHTYFSPCLANNSFFSVSSLNKTIWYAFRAN